ncbi:MAG: peptide chain release factor 2 [Candidatus Omnitrophica bacterium]|nr:peptide chain release factor 2 [Candidatus Omnitrophota bacterium]
MREEIAQKISDVQEMLQRLRGYLDIDDKDRQIAELQARMTDGNFWQNPSSANQLVRDLKALKNISESWHRHDHRAAEIAELFHLSENEGEEFLAHLDADIHALKDELARLEFLTLFSGEFDRNNAIVSINAGAGGTESCDWVSMLLRMYTRWADGHGFKVTVTDILPGEEAGTKNVTMIVHGDYAYGYLRAEVGVHRLVRISPFDANKRRHTSFASVDVIPELEEDIEVEIKPEELRIDVYRAGGKGGQHVNTTDSAVRITHLPTGIVAQCQNERSQHQNKQVALAILKSRLHEREAREQEAKMSHQHQEKQKIEWGSQIRSYVLHPYNMVKDHRTDFETGDSGGVLDGKLDGFIEAYLRMVKTIKT